MRPQTFSPAPADATDAGGVSPGEQAVNPFGGIGQPAVDPIEEMRLRTWARRHFTPVAGRRGDWHPLVLDEMERIDAEPVV